MTPSIPRRAKVVIVGGGVIGCSIAYHLTKLGWQDVVLLERKQLTCGTTWHAAGLLTTLRSTENATKLAKYTQDLYAKLEEETGLSTGIMRVGSLQIASDYERLEEMRRGCAMAGIFGVESREVTPAQVQELWPLADVSDILAGFYFPTDGRTNPTDTTMSLAKGARMGGAKIVEGVKVLDVVKRGDRVVAVTTDAGDIEADYVVNCTGMWAREFGLRAGVNIPLQAAEHYYLITESLEGMHANLPILRDPGNVAYYREETGKLMLGLFEPVAAVWGEKGIPEEFCFDELPPDWERVTPYLEKAMSRVPSMTNVGVRILFNGPESFTPDHNYLMGRAPGLQNYYVAAGFNSLGILSGGGAGMVLAHWIVNGHPPMDVFDSDIRRVHDFQGNAKYLQDRTVESLGIGYQHHWPFRQWETARDVKKLVLHDRVAAAGACFGESAGWERPNWYAPAGVRPQYEYTFKRQNWFEYNAQEHRAVREKVGLFEQSSFSKFLVQGKDAEKVLNKISANNVAVIAGKAVYTQFLNERGGIEADLTITRLGAEEYLVVTAAFTHSHVLAWIREHIPDNAHCSIADITGAYGMLNLQGPLSRDLLSKLTDSDLSLEAFPFGTMQDIEIGYQKIKALRITYVGELGWELYVPTEYLLPVYDKLIDAGQAFELKHCGYHALNSLRIEKAYREWAHDIGADDTPIEAGLGFACDFKKAEGFVGREALLRQKELGVPSKRLVQFLLKDPEPLLYHAEPIVVNGEANGFTSSAMYGHTLGGSVAMGYLYRQDGVTQDWLDSADIKINVAGQLVSATASLKPLYDPSSSRIRV
ncbi:MULTISPECIES: FAD-dependent oxidoreductase [unclassified Sphingopyxis]|jgi:glycine cleavage system aminomethyltransferase T/glycine/D-amino acid oxidase-like deaminating enzyme|uniref:GcvT family protein n=1 Tax=unclassified Sphingopyxis TaxID=2614943 RepID=UPI00072FC7A9|nr:MULTISPECIES: FAD-dependent oxidoreductase [unclassified Sphingopyxis]KTE24064.1 FAD-dependent oxidoreductase [Sphingopyxis sp. H057]KTE50363.1 FAD-dependent oxidoreductase [Sphingopyxis sp. H073]KTE52451.1 FAD-dependent oxidoreductase [Sphingopyxis sp. H071]KTE62944.1 FAD-dependent oxidoreductase [Sphingopyxis sp. H107]KTE64834.1 FAD-dependent oxidoreductase [Sphingopyxis sp. H100]